MSGLSFGDFGEMLFEVVRPDVEEHREPAVLRVTGRRTSMTTTRPGVASSVKFRASENLRFGSRSGYRLLRKTHRGCEQD